MNEWVYCTNCINIETNLKCTEEGNFIEAMDNLEFCKCCPCYKCNCCDCEDSRLITERPNYKEK